MHINFFRTHECQVFVAVTKSTDGDKYEWRLYSDITPPEEDDGEDFVRGWDVRLILRHSNLSSSDGTLDRTPDRNTLDFITRLDPAAEGSSPLNDIVFTDSSGKRKSLLHSYSQNAGEHETTSSTSLSSHVTEILVDQIKDEVTSRDFLVFSFWTQKEIYLLPSASSLSSSTFSSSSLSSIPSGTGSPPLHHFTVDSHLYFHLISQERIYSELTSSRKRLKLVSHTVTNSFMTLTPIVLSDPSTYTNSNSSTPQKADYVVILIRRWKTTSTEPYYYPTVTEVSTESDSSLTSTESSARSVASVSYERTPYYESLYTSTEYYSTERTIGTILPTVPSPFGTTDSSLSMDPENSEGSEGSDGSPWTVSYFLSWIAVGLLIMIGISVPIFIYLLARKKRRNDVAPDDDSNDGR